MTYLVAIAISLTLLPVWVAMFFDHPSRRPLI